MIFRSGVLGALALVMASNGHAAIQAQVDEDRFFAVLPVSADQVSRSLEALRQLHMKNPGVRFRLLLAADDPTQLKEDQLLELGQILQKTLPGSEIELFDIGVMRLLADWGVHRLPVFIRMNRNKAHLVHSPESIFEVLKCDK